MDTTPFTREQVEQPVRIQRRRARGFRLQDQSPDGRPVVSVTRPGKWGNEFRVEPEDGRYFVVDANRVPWGPGDGFATRAEAATYAVRLYGGGWLEGKVHSGQLDLSELRGKHLACFCPPGAPCHADLLLTWANADPMPDAKNHAFPVKNGASPHLQEGSRP